MTQQPNLGLGFHRVWRAKKRDAAAQKAGVADHAAETAEVTMSISARLEKLRFLAAEMQLAFRLSQFAPTDFEARVLVRHVIIRAEGFIEHARGLRRPLTRLGFPTEDFHRTKENYANIFDEYFRLARDRLGAHVQDIDFGRRIELWNDIDISKSEFLANGAIEIYRMLSELSIPGCVPYADFSVLSEFVFKEALKAYRASGTSMLNRLRKKGSRLRATQDRFVETRVHARNSPRKRLGDSFPSLVA
ncbi:MAG: hypothetical protein ACP5NI_01395 [Acetobacteraceae bacterium]